MRFRLETRYADYDTKGHVNNAVYLTYFEIARHRAWVDGMHQGPDFSFILAQATIKFVSEALIGDELTIEIKTIEVRNKAWVWSYVVRAPAERVVAEGSTVQVMYDYDAKRSIPVPDGIRQALGKV